MIRYFFAGYIYTTFNFVIGTVFIWDIPDEGPNVKHYVEKAVNWYCSV